MSSHLLYKTPRGETALHLDEVPDDGLSLHEAGLRPATAEPELLDAVTLELKVLREEEGGFALLGNFPFRVNIVCSRCLEPFEHAGKANFAYFMLPAAEAPKTDETHLGDADMDCVYFEDDELVLNRLVEEQLLLAIPPKPLCREECGGLCPTCGQNLNLAACGCAAPGAASPPSVFDKITDDIFGDKK
jgi:uncharacterized protein